MIVVFGANHNTCSIEELERLRFDQEQLGRFCQKFPQIVGRILLQTCNRWELYIECDDEVHFADLSKALVEELGESVVSEQPNLYLKTDSNALTHLFEVVCSLQSVIVGENQIQSQVKSALLCANEENQSLGLRRAFEMAVVLGKKARSETAISRGAVSISQAGIELAAKFFGGLKGVSVMIIGAGEMARLALEHLNGKGLAEVKIANRTIENARKLIGERGVEPMALPQTGVDLAGSDLVLVAIGGDDWRLTKELVKSGIEARKYRQQVIVDISLPRMVEDDVSQVENVYLYDISDLKQVTEGNLMKRQSEEAQIRQMIEHAVHEYKSWENQKDKISLFTQVDCLKDAIVVKSSDGCDEKHRALQKGLGKMSHVLYQMLKTCESDTQKQKWEKILNEALNF
jgi:glutamyl-tRNA reductase